MCDRDRAEHTADPLDALIAGMIADTGEPDSADEAWAANALEVARRAAQATPT